jgi:hypothetical protein
VVKGKRQNRCSKPRRVPRLENMLLAGERVLTANTTGRIFLPRQPKARRHLVSKAGSVLRRLDSIECCCCSTRRPIDVDDTIGVFTVAAAAALGQIRKLIA